MFVFKPVIINLSNNFITFSNKSMISFCFILNSKFFNNKFVLEFNIFYIYILSWVQNYKISYIKLILFFEDITVLLVLKINFDNGDKDFILSIYKENST